MDSPKGKVQEELQRLREENACLKVLLMCHDIAWEETALNGLTSIHCPTPM